MVKNLTLCDIFREFKELPKDLLNKDLFKNYNISDSINGDLLLSFYEGLVFNINPYNRIILVPSISTTDDIIGLNTEEADNLLPGIFSLYELANLKFPEGTNLLEALQEIEKLPLKTSRKFVIATINLDGVIESINNNFIN